MEIKVHVFEAAGLGKAPFRWLGCYEKVGPIDLGNGLFAGSPGQPMGTCNFCGTGIKEVHSIKSSDGKISEVGCDCVLKTGDAGLKRIINAHKAEQNKKRETARIEKALGVWNSEKRTLVGGAWNPMSEDALDLEMKKSNQYSWAVFTFQHGGHSGHMKVTRLVEKAQAALEIPA